jgi:hypothetical protein
VFAPSDLLIHVSVHLQKLVELLEGSHLPAMRARLCSITGETALLISVLFLEIGMNDKMRSFGIEAIKAAHESDNAALQSVGWGWISFSYGNDPLEALSCVQRARHIAKSMTDIRIRTWLAAIEAEIQARLSDTNACFQALDEAQYIEDQQHTDSLQTEKSYHWTWFNSSLLAGYQGNCFQRLSASDNAQKSRLLRNAQTALKAAIASPDPTLARRQPYYVLDLAGTYIQQGEIEEACHELLHVVNMPFQMRSYTALKRLMELRQSLGPWEKTSCVQSLDAHLLPLIALPGKEKTDV